MVSNDRTSFLEPASSSPAAVSGVRAVRVAIDQATPVPPSIPPPPSIPTPQERAAEAWEHVRKSPLFTPERFRHLRPGFLDRSPLKLYGVDAHSGRLLYRDAEELRRALLPDEHDRDGIASLFAGAEAWLGRLWPAPRGGWDDEAAAETLFFFESCVGVVDGRQLGFIIDLPPLVRR